MKFRSIAVILVLVFIITSVLTACVEPFDDYEGNELKEWTVSFIVDDETYFEISVDRESAEYDIFPEEPVKEGFYFLGWFLDKDEWRTPFAHLELLWFGNFSGEISVFAKFEQRVGLIINQIYGLGEKNNDDQAGSHSFVEIYNTNDYPLSLSGYSLQSATNGNLWQKLDLQGEVPAKSSFLIVLDRYTNMSARLLITEYDMLWQNAYFVNKDLKVVLLKSLELISVANPFDYNGKGSKIEGYIDMIGVAGNDKGRTIDGYETDYLGGRSEVEAAFGQSKQKAVRRIDFIDTDNNALDLEVIDYRTCDLKYRPKNSSFGEWTSVDDEGIAFDPLDFPVLHIDTQNMQAITSKDIYVPSVVSLSNTVVQYDVDYGFNNVSAEIRGRGNSSWSLEKKPYRLKFAQQRSILDSGYQARNWTLIACHSDKSLLRNYGAYYLASMLDGMYFAPNAWFVDLYLNGKYQGVYMLSDQIQQNEGRAELTYDADPAKCEYLFEWDGRAPEEGVEDIDWISVNNIPIAVKFPTDSALTSAHITYIKDVLTTLDNSIKSGDYDEISSLIHENSFIDFFLVQELYKNVDVGSLSLWFQLKGQGDDRKILMGPVWDFDIAAGNADYVPYEYEGIWAQSQNRWFDNLMQIEDFRVKVIQRWNEIKDDQIDAMLTHVESMASAYEKAFERNFMIWNILDSYIWPNPPEVVQTNTFAGQVEYLQNFLLNRKDWLDAYYNSLLD